MSATIVPALGAVNRYHTVFCRLLFPQPGIGSVPSIVAVLVFTLLENGVLAMFVALAHASFAGTPVGVIVEVFVGPDGEVEVGVGVLVAPGTIVGVRVGVRVCVGVEVGGISVPVRVTVGLSVGVAVTPDDGVNVRLKSVLPAVPLLALTMKKYFVPPVTEIGRRDWGVLNASSLQPAATGLRAGHVPV